MPRRRSSFPQDFGCAAGGRHPPQRTSSPWRNFSRSSGGHLLPALHHAAPPMHARPPAKPSEEDLAQNEQTEGLPEADAVPSEKRRRQPVPQTHHHQAEHGDADDYQQRDFQYPNDPVSSHTFSYPFVNS